MNTGKAIKILNSINADAMLVTSEENMHYFCSFSPSEGMIVITKSGCKCHFVDSRYTENAQKYAEKTGFEVVEVNGGFVDSVNTFLTNNSVKTLAFENETISYKRYCTFKRELKAELVELNNELGKIRNIKSSEEIEFMLEAQRIAEKSYLELLNHYKEGKTEKELAAYFDYLMAKNGSDGVSFSTILLSGKNTSMPHGVPSDRKLKKGEFVLADFGATYKGYHSDTTRTVALGYASDEMKFCYNLVLESQLAGIKAMEIGARCSDVYQKAYDVLQKKGYARYFRHALGHGVGLEIHEGYSASPKSEDIFEEGNVCTVEPGIYIPEKFGIRIEDVIYLGKDKKQNLVSLDKNLIIV